MKTRPTSTPGYTTRQVMLSLSYLAYCGDKITTPNPAPAILTIMNRAIPQIAPVASWQVVWGPVAYTTPGALYQDNLMYVAQDTANPTDYAVAIRGTNSVSDLDWLMDDFDVLQMMPWQTAAGARISESTSIGLQVLLRMSSNLPAGAGDLLTLISFLRKTAQEAPHPINLYVTGHSLGGCLAGTLGLFLKERVSQWGGRGVSTISCVTFAAPTAGNQEFAAYSEAQFRGGPYPPRWDTTLGYTFDAVRCDLDIAPLAWVADKISDSTTSSPIFDRYVPQLDFREMAYTNEYAWKKVVLADLLPEAATTLRSRNYAQPVADAAPIRGTINTNPGYVSYDQYFAHTFNCFVKQATYQHNDSYPTLLNVPALLNPHIIVEGASAEPAAQPAARQQLVARGLDLLMQHYSATVSEKPAPPKSKQATKAVKPTKKPTTAAKPAAKPEKAKKTGPASRRADQ